MGSLSEFLDLIINFWAWAEFLVASPKLGFTLLGQSSGNRNQWVGVRLSAGRLAALREAAAGAGEGAAELQRALAPTERGQVEDPLEDGSPGWGWRGFGGGAGVGGGGGGGGGVDFDEDGNYLYSSTGRPPDQS